MAKYEVLVDMALNDTGEHIWKTAAIMLVNENKAGFIFNRDNSGAAKKLKELSGADIGSRLIARFGELVESGEQDPMHKLRWEFINEKFFILETSEQEGL